MLLVVNYVQRSNMKHIKGQFISRIDIGKVRVVNEDRALSIVNPEGDVLLAVCDGLGGHNKGDYASQLALNILVDEFRKKPKFYGYFSIRIFLSRVLKMMNHEIFSTAENNQIYQDMGSTIVLALLHKSRVYIAYAGDSRAYGLKNGVFTQLSEDQSYVDYLYKTGQIKKEEMSISSDRHKLMNALGIYPTISYSLVIVKNDFDSIFLCSDGVYNNMNDRQIADILLTKERLEQKVDTLIAVANSNGGSDNMAISLWEKIKND